MKITYIHHSSFMAELNYAVFLFDYFEGNIPETDREKPLFVFTSHRHGDHLSHSIFDLEESHGNVAYVLSDGTWIRQMPEDLLDRTVFLGPGKEVSLRDGAGNPVDIQTFKSADKRVAFLISLEHRTIYHAGDLNDWVWEGKPGAGNCRMSESFHREMDKLAGRHIDVASMFIGPRQEKDFYLGMDDFMRMAGANMVFPMYFWEDFQAAAGFKALVCTDEYRDRIQEIHRRGEEPLM